MLTNDEKVKQIIKRIKYLSDQRTNLLNTINAQPSLEEECQDNASKFKDLLSIEKAFNLEVEALTTNQEML
jgi:uncharacterized protein YnzC (UPF0291/DUF896 family)